jgi:hypothetical protein
MLNLQGVGPKAESLALAAGDRIGVPVGFDPDLDFATFDADSLELEELEARVVEALGTLDPDWRSHLEVVDES